MTTTTAAALNSTTLTALHAPRWHAEFPTYAFADMPALPRAWEDVSWHNDACPCFVVAGVNGGEMLRAWVDYRDPNNRDNGPDMPRFLLQWDTFDGSAGRVVYEGEDVAKLIAFGQLEALAYRFAMGLRRELLATEWQALRIANRSSAPGGCNANDYCDANMVMLAAFTEITGRDPLATGDGFADADMAAFNDAWDIARQHHLTADVQGETFDAWRITGHDVADLDAAGVETGRVDGDTATRAGRVYDPGFLTLLDDGCWHCVTSNHDQVFEHLTDAETYLWANYAMWEYDVARSPFVTDAARDNRFRIAISNARATLAMVPGTDADLASLDAILAQHGCETFDPAAPYLTDLISVVIDG